jgi:hypothetical protein
VSFFLTARNAHRKLDPREKGGGPVDSRRKPREVAAA